MKKTIFLLLAAASACTIKNDIDYPLVPGDITDFVVDHQMSVEINKANRTVHAEVAENADLTQLELLRFSVSDEARCKELKVGDILDLSEPMSVHVRTYQDYVWTIYATVRVSAEIEVNAWAGSAVFTTPADGATADGVYEWRKEGSSEWASSPEITAQAGLYVYEATGLEPGTNYYVRFTLSGTSSGEVAFSTEAEEQVANMGFDEWCSETVYSTKTSWYPAPDATNGGRVWDSANKGVLFIGRDCATTPEAEFVAVSGDGKQAARMESMFPNFLGMGRFAAGNLLTGEFLGTSGSGSNLGARMSWGTPFTTRPSALKGWYAYSPQPIDHDDLGKHPDLVGQTDGMQILVMLGDWDSPFEVNTAEGIFIDQENDPHIIAYGKIETTEATIDGEGNLRYVQFNCPLEYRDRSRKPKYVIINACASRYGDDFTGAVGSLLYVDEFEFVY